MTSARDSENTKEVGDVTGGSQLCTKFTSTFLVVTQSFLLFSAFFSWCVDILSVCLFCFFLPPRRERVVVDIFSPKGQKVRVTELLLRFCPPFPFPSDPRGKSEKRTNNIRAKEREQQKPFFSRNGGLRWKGSFPSFSAGFFSFPWHIDVLMGLRVGRKLSL